jgi:hypothetical protein
VCGLIGPHPLAVLAVQTALVAAAAVLLHDLLRRFVDDRLAAATAALWLVVPNHTSLLLWASATAITAALLLLLLGGIARAADRPGPATVCLAASILTYEATAPAAVALLVAIPLLQRRPWRRPLLVGMAGVAPATAWALPHLPSVKDAGRSHWADLGLVLPAHVGWGVFPEGPIATALGLAAIVLLGFAARRSPLVAAGVVVIVVGTLPFLRYFYEPLGAGDRVNVVAGVGTAMVWAGLLRWLGEILPWRPVAATAGLVVVGAMATAGLQRSSAWAAAVDDGVRILRSLPPPDGDGSITVERPPVRQNVTAFADRSNIDSAVQLQRGRRALVARLRPAR